MLATAATAALFVSSSADTALAGTVGFDIIATVDVLGGDVTLQSDTFDGLSAVTVLSPSGGLVPTNVELPAGFGVFSELETDITLGTLGAAADMSGSGLSLGAIYNTTLDPQDLSFILGDASGNPAEILPADVNYINVPEPATGLLLIGGCGLLVRRRR
ncbi:MAG: PEP-CTERM sorting domain-containing protein [Planctomycetota bacterium]